MSDHTGTFACPHCGVAEPHHHSPQEVWELMEANRKRAKEMERRRKYPSPDTSTWPSDDTPNTPPSAEEMANDLERAVEQHRRRESPRGSMSMHETYVVRLIEALRTRSENAAVPDPLLRKLRAASEEATRIYRRAAEGYPVDRMDLNDHSFRLEELVKEAIK